MSSQPLTIPLPGFSSASGGLFPGSTLETASHLLAGNIEAELIPSAFSSLLRSLFLLSLLFSFVLLLVLHSSMRLPVTVLRYSRHELVLRLRPLGHLQCVVTHGGGDGETDLVLE